jgi:hypothetical protein
MSKTRSKIRFDQLSTAEKEALYHQCERIGVNEGQSLDAQDRRRHRRVALRIGRPRVGKGVKRINVSMEKGLLGLADAAARRRGITRARLIAESVKAYLNSAA